MKVKDFNSLQTSGKKVHTDVGYKRRTEFSDRNITQFLTKLVAIKQDTLLILIFLIGKI